MKAKLAIFVATARYGRGSGAGAPLVRGGVRRTEALPRHRRARQNRVDKPSHLLLPRRQRRRRGHRPVDAFGGLAGRAVAPRVQARRPQARRHDRCGRLPRQRRIALHGRQARDAARRTHRVRRLRRRWRPGRSPGRRVRSRFSEEDYPFRCRVVPQPWQPWPSPSAAASARN